MGKIGRIACIATPMAMTIASLILLIIVFMGGMSKSNESLSSLYYFKVSLKNLQLSIDTADDCVIRPIPRISNTT